jgi:predicted acyltransferase
MTASQFPANRVVSLDFMRGLIMVLLALESAGLYEHLHELDSTTVKAVAGQFFHHPWHGLTFWDNIQPAFMFIAGVAMAFSLDSLWKKGVTWNATFWKVAKRCALLFLLGVLNYAVKRDGSLSFELWNVLTQLSFTTMVAFLIFRWPYLWQIVVCVALLLLTEVLYRYTNIAGYNQPFVNHHNFGNYMDWVLMKKLNHEGWVAINCIPTAVHTIGGAIVGRVLLEQRVVKPLVIWGIISLILGTVIDLLDVTPIIKKIATTSFTLVTLGFCLLVYAFIFWWIDLKNHKKHLWFFIIVGLNSLFIYLFFEIVASRWFNGYMASITNGIMNMVNTPEQLRNIITSLLIFAVEWWMCYFLYRKNVFIKV